MGFVKAVKNKAYFKRFQTKFRRRREGKTDYYARKRLINQAKNKYNSPKYRLVVRFTNKDVVCQIVYSKIQGDFTLASAYSHELPHYGITVGLTNWAAAYCTGLLLARRVLSKLGLAEIYQGTLEADGSYAEVEAVEGKPRPFKVFLDVGLARTSTGSRVFAAMKGASDGGVFVPHSETRFPGYDQESKNLDSETLRNYIFGGHVADYMRHLSEEDDEKYRRQFSKFIEAGIGPDDLENLYRTAHQKIRENPIIEKQPKEKPTTKHKSYKKPKLNNKQRKHKAEQKKASFQRQLGMEIEE